MIRGDGWVIWVSGCLMGGLIREPEPLRTDCISGVSDTWVCRSCLRGRSTGPGHENKRRQRRQRRNYRPRFLFCNSTFSSLNNVPLALLALAPARLLTCRPTIILAVLLTLYRISIGTKNTREATLTYYR